MNLPKISCICLTYRRPELLEEAIESFVRQDYKGEKELIILNDEPEQTLVLDIPNVIVKNMGSRAPSLPEKYNFAAGMASGHLIVPWDDDDVYLPWRLSTIATQAVGGAWYADHLFTDNEDPKKLTVVSGIIHCNHAFSHRMLVRLGAYHDEQDMSFDFVVMNKLRKAVQRKAPDNVIPSYIYRKNSTPGPNYSNLYQPDKSKILKIHEKETPLKRTGEIKLKPKWSRNWTKLARKTIKKQPIPVPLHEVDKSYKPVGVQAEQKVS